jgi:ADP-heptose:LPS heptosyltransferase
LTVLVLRALGLGDLLTVVPALRALRDAYPRDRIALATPRELEPIARLTGAVDEVVHVRGLRRLPQLDERPVLAVNLHGRGPQSHELLLDIKPTELLAFAHATVAASLGGPEWCQEEHEVERWCRLLAARCILADPAHLELAPPRATSPALEPGVTIVHPGAKSPARRWPPERFAAVARAELAAGRDVVITGSSDERRLAAAVSESAGLAPGRNLAGRTSLPELAALVHGAGRVVSGDTGIAHVATAFGTPSVVLFGPTSPMRWGPPPTRPSHRVLWAGREGDPLAKQPFDGLLEIQVGDVLAELAQLDRCHPSTADGTTNE